MSIKQQMNDAIREAMKEKQQVRLETLRMAKAALLLKEKEGPKDQPLSDSDAIGTLRTEIRKRQQSIQTYTELNRPEEVDRLLQELAVFEEFLPRQLSEEELEVRVRNYLRVHSDLTHAGKLTGAMKKELGDEADGRLLSEVCKRVLEGQ